MDGATAKVRPMRSSLRVSDFRYDRGANLRPWLSFINLAAVLVVPDGYGLSYSIGDDHIRWTITSLKKDVGELRHYLAEAATETRRMMERAAAAEKAKSSSGEGSKAKL